MTSNWQTVPMGELCSIQSGKSDTKDAVADGPYAFFDRSKSIKRSSRFLRDCEALIIPGEGAAFLPRHFVGKFDLHQRAYALFDFSPRLVIKFLYYYLHHVANYFPRVAVGATVKSLRLRHFEQLPVRLTDPATQRRIVAILDEAFEGIATAKANADRCLRNAQSLARSRIDSVFTNRSQTWPESPLEGVAAIVNGYAFKSTDFGVMSGVRSIKITNVGVGQFVADEDNRLPAHFAQTHVASMAKAGSIVLALTRTIIAGGVKVAVVPQAYDGALVNQRVAVIAPREQMLLTPFLFLFLSSQRVALYVKDRVNTLMQPNLSIVDLRALPVPTPALSEQRVLMHQLAEFQCEARRLEQVYARKLAALDELKKSLLHQAFTGAL